MLSMDLFTEGQRISLFFPKKQNMVEMVCNIEKVFNDRLNLVLPQYFMRYIENLQVGKKVTAKAFSKLGTVDFNTIIISSPLEETFTIEMDYNSIKLTPSEDTPFIKAVESLEIKKDVFELVTICESLRTRIISLFSYVRRCYFVY